VTSTAKAAARVGVSFTPAGDIIDFCELTTGKEFCIPDGPSLSTVERTFAGIGIFLGSRKMWSYMAEGFETASGLGKAVKGAAAVEEAAEEIIKYGPLRKGPLHTISAGSATVAETFRSSSYFEVTLSRPVKLFRVYGGRAGELAPYWSRTKPSGPLQAQLDAAILPEFQNAITKWVEIEVPAGVKVFEGVASSQFLKASGSNIPAGQQLGGGNQVYIPRVEASWIKLRGSFQ
jgi:hypothetical protein